MRLASLDSLRGIAALAVVFYHALLVLPSAYDLLFDRGVPITESRSYWAALLTLSPLSLLWSGREAVLLFFVLSGFVLALPFVAGRNPRYAAFAVKRAVRLLAPSMAAVLLSAGAAMLILPGDRPDISPWPGITWSEPVTAPVLIRHLLLLDDLYSLNNVLWTLEYELWASLAFPLLVMLAFAKLPVAAAGALCVMALGVAEARLLGSTLLGAFTAVPHFLLGILLARHRATVLPRFASAGPMSRGVLWGVCYLLLSARWLLPFPGAICDLINGMGAALLIALVLSSTGAQRALSLPPLVRLGTLSYSLYLVHVPMIVGTLHLAPHWMPVPVILACAVPLCLAMAVLLHRLVEQPSIRWGRYLAARLEPDPARRAQGASWPAGPPGPQAP